MGKMTLEMHRLTSSTKVLSNLLILSTDRE
jgi:hypothetical protein